MQEETEILRDRIIKIMETEQDTLGDKEEISEEAEELIKEIADDCRNTQLFKANKGKIPEWMQGRSSYELYMHMLVRVANAPTRLHAQATPILMLPVIADALRKEEMNG